MKHTINIDDAKEYQFEHTMASSHGKGENKWLEVSVKNGSCTYLVYSHKKIIRRSSILKYAVEAYNQA